MRDVTPTTAQEAVTDEERLVAELELLGIRYLSRQSAYQASSVREPANLLGDLVRQPSARVRASVIAVLLAHPGFATAAPAALHRLGPAEQLTLKLFYTAASLLQQVNASRLRLFVSHRWRWLPDSFSAELGLPHSEAPAERLIALSEAHARLTGTAVNWAGTYTNVVDRLLRRWELERKWSQ